MNLLTLIFVGLLSISHAVPSKHQSCDGCARLEAIEARARRQILLSDTKFAPLSAQAARAITDIARRKPKLGDAEIDAIVSAYRLFVPKDPVGAILKLTAPVIVTNREAIDAKVALLPRAESKFLAHAIENATMETKMADEEETSATPPPAGTPGEAAE